MIQKVLKKTRRSKDGQICESRSYYLRFRFDPMPKDRWISLKTTDKQVALKKGQELMQEMQQEAAGLLPAKSLRTAGAKPLYEHLEDFLCDLKSKGRTKKHVDDNRSRISRLLTECGWKVLADVDADGFIQWRNEYCDVLAAKTLNEYLASIVGLFNWMEKVGRISANPLRRVERVDGRGKLKRERRAFTEAELKRLIEVSGTRGLIYLFAARTGLRRNEINQLTWNDVYLNEAQPFVLARACITKNKKDERIFLVPEIVEKLVPLSKEAPNSNAPVFMDGAPKIKAMKRDLIKAEIPYCDEKGRYADFHALRHTCATFMLKHGVPAAYAKKHMRHSDLKLTTNCYNDDAQLDVYESLSKLPRVDGQRAQIRAQISGVGGHYVTHSDAFGEGSDPTNDPTKTGSRRTVAQGVATNDVERVMGIEPTSRFSS